MVDYGKRSTDVENERSNGNLDLGTGLRGSECYEKENKKNKRS